MRSCRKNETPIAEMRGMKGARRRPAGDLLDGDRQRARGHAISEHEEEHERPGQALEHPAPWRPSRISTPMKAPRMKISECAKLMNSSTP